MKHVASEEHVSGYPLWRRLSAIVRGDLREIYARDLRKWLLIAPAVGVVTGLVVTGIAIVILRELWPAVLSFYLRHWWAIVPGLVLGCGVAGALMQFFTPDPDEHSTEEVIRSYHEHNGRIDARFFVPKILAAIATVGMGGSAALEGPSIYGGGAIGSWMWKHFVVREGSRRARVMRKLRLDDRERRILLICGAAAGMSAVFRAPLTGIVFALEMPYRDDLAHEALVPSLLASVVAFVTLGAFLGTAPLFDFQGSTSFTRTDVYWSALLGLLIGLVSVVFTMLFRRVRRMWIDWSWPHWIKLATGGLLTGLCGLGFLALYPGNLTPLGPNYEAVDMILNGHHGSAQLVVFSVFKLAATLFTLAAGGVSAMFVPLFLTGGSLGTAFAQSIVHTPATGLFAAVGMASFLSAGYKTPLAAVVFVAEATGGHAFIVPALIGAAVAYAVSGDASASGEQRLHEGERVREFEA
ncbi:MAG: chloride channel protein [Acidobacteriaceae bacterium]